ncbi:MAG: hypothetical protein ABIZ52_03910, partial [Candidatus Limnocylindrales bacterium]
SAPMAKRTRYGSKSSAKPAAKRVPGPGAKPAMPGSGLVRGATSTGGVAIPHTHDHDHDGHDHGETPLRSGAALTEAEVARAAELEAEAMATERAAIAESLRRRARGQASDLAAAGDINAPLSVRMSHEYDYVSRDVKRIALTASLMVTILAVLHILVNVLGVITL